MCIIETCKKSKTYNYAGLKAEYCSDHKLVDMINVRHDICTECNLQASFGYLPDNIRERCRIHMLPDMINLKHKNTKCADATCMEARHPNLNGYCSLKCFINDNDEYIYTDNSKILYKEYLLFKHLKQTYTYKIIWDKIFCCGYRPDFRIQFDNFAILIELDELQHRAYGKKEEIDRIENMYHMINEPLYIIRFNPDHYRDTKRVRSPFKNNVLINSDDWNNRLTCLIETINTCINDGLCGNLPSMYSIHYLFYDLVV